MCCAGQMLRRASGGNGSHPADGLAALQAALTNVHDFLIHTAARLQVGGAKRVGHWESSGHGSMGAAGLGKQAKLGQAGRRGARFQPCATHCTRPTAGAG